MVCIIGNGIRVFTRICEVGQLFRWLGCSDFLYNWFTNTGFVLSHVQTVKIALKSVEKAELNTYIYSFLHQGKGMHIKLKHITKFVLICISISDESVKAELKKRDRQRVHSESSLRGDSLPCVWGKMKHWGCAGMAEKRWKSAWLQSLRSPPPMFDPVFRSAGCPRAAEKAKAVVRALAWRRGQNGFHKLQPSP